MRRLEYNEVVKANFDAKIYSEYIAQNFGAVFAYGGMCSTYQKALNHCEILAKITGNTLVDTIYKARDDYYECRGLNCKGRKIKHEGS